MSEYPPPPPTPPSPSPGQSPGQNPSPAPGAPGGYGPGYQPPDRDGDHLKILSICWYIWSSLVLLMSCGAIIYLVIGIVFLVSPPPTHAGDPPPELFGGIFTGVGACGMLLGWTVAALGFITAGALRKRRKRGLCFTTAVISCLNVPMGTVLGVFTLVVLSRPSVKASFESPGQP